MTKDLRFQLDLDTSKGCQETQGSNTTRYKMLVRVLVKLCVLLFSESHLNYFNSGFIDDLLRARIVVTCVDSESHFLEEEPR